MSVRSLRWSVAPLALAVALAATAAPARHPSRHHRMAGPALIVRGDQVSTEGLVDAVAAAFDATGEGHLEVTPFNTIDGIDRALAGTVDIAASARPAYPGHPQESQLTFTPVAWDALVLITNAANPVPNLTLRQIHGIYYGRIKNWSEVGGPDEPIDLDGVASPLDGVQFSFRRLLLGNGDSTVAVPRLFINVDSLQSEVALDPNALAVSTLAHARRQKDVRVIPVEGVTPSLATLANGTYPLPLTIYLAYRPDSPKLTAIQAFLRFLGGPRAGSILRRHDLLPYAQATALNAVTEQQRIDALGARMVAEGLPPAYAPGHEFARLIARYPEIDRAMGHQHHAALELAAANAAAGKTTRADPPHAAPTADYTVVSGDTLWKIARTHAVSVADLRRWNGLHSDRLQVGQVLRVTRR